MKKIVLLLIMMSFAYTGYAQDTLTLPYSVQGKVCDAGSGRPIRSVSVSMTGRYYATVTNSDGEFTLKSDTPIREVTFSHIGYRTATLPASSRPMRVDLSPDAEPIAGAVVTSGDPLDIVLSAIKKIPDNYADTSELLKCFYRETVQKRQRYIQVTEAVAKVFKPSYGNWLHNGRAALLKSRTLVSSRKRDTLSVKFLGGPTIAVNMDFIKVREALLDRDELDLYRLELGSPVYIDGRLNFAVHLRPASVADYALYTGTLYIDQESLAFSRMDLSLDMRDEAKATQAILRKKPAGLRFHPKEASILINFREDDGRYRLGYMRTTMRFDCDWRKRLLKSNYTSINELVITDLYPQAEQITRQEAFRTTESLSDMTDLFTDPEFWKDYNIIEPSTSLEHAVDKLKRQ